MVSRLFSERFFRRFGLLTVYSIFFLIFVGGLVRVSGSGMGCPDWPKCFGKWVPPTHESQLPFNYKELFRTSTHEVADFNVFHTWTEYINRLVGVFTGIFIFITMVSSFQFWKSRRSITLLSILAFLLVGFQGWIGARVVATNLAPWMVSIHMLLALVIVGMVMFAVFRNTRTDLPENTRFNARTFMTITLTGMGITLVQIGTGLKVREKIDHTMYCSNDDNWLLLLGGVFESHRFLSVFVLAACIYAYQYAGNFLGKAHLLSKASLLALVCTLLQLITGSLNAWFHLPPVAQVLHIAVAVFILGFQFYAVIVTYNSTGKQNSGSSVTGNPLKVSVN